jgi:hypothetical protein
MATPPFIGSRRKVENSQEKCDNEPEGKAGFRVSQFEGCDIYRRLFLARLSPTLCATSKQFDLLARKIIGKQAARPPGQQRPASEEVAGNSRLGTSAAARGQADSENRAEDL